MKVISFLEDINMDTTERIKDILQDMINFKYDEISLNILKLQLEMLVIQAQLEQLEKEK